MTEIIITKNITPNKINKLFETHLKKKELDNVILSIPDSINKYTFGLLADLLKLVITLNKKTTIKTLKINADIKKIDSLYDQEYTYPIVSLLWNSSKFVDKSGNDIKVILREKQNEFFIKMNSLSKLKGNKYILTNTDHLPKSKGLIRLLENADGFNDNEEQIAYNIKKLLYDFILTFNKKNIHEIDQIANDIGVIIYELLKNTYEWGKTDTINVNIPSSIRGVYLRFHNNDSKTITEEFKNTPLDSYFKQDYIVNNCINKNNKIYFLEILVFDSGVGFIDKFHKKNSLTDLEIIKKCLIKNQTSSVSNLKSKKGLGLERILNIINDRGFLRITTDKYSLYRDLIRNNHKPTKAENLETLILEDWNWSRIKSENKIKIGGTHMNILYPFKSIS